MSLKYGLFTAIICFIFPIGLKSQNSKLPRQYICYKTDTPLIIDGCDNETAWKLVPWTDDFCDIQGCEQTKPRFRTRAKMLWNEQYLYVFAQLYEPHVWANLRQRDTIIYHDNDFEVFVDPDGDTHHYYEFEMNALNTQWDLLLTKPYRDRGTYINAWDYDGLKTAVHIAGTINNPADIDTCWTVELAFPLKSYADSGIHNPPHAGDQWRINFSRVEWQTVIENGKYSKVKNKETGKPLPEDNWVWSPQGVIDMHRLETWGFVQFSDYMAGKGTDEFRPNPDEALKMQLRELYYKQRNYYNAHKQFAQTLNELDIPKTYAHIKFRVHSSAQAYELTLKSSFSSCIWHINEAGRVWATGKPQNQN